MTADVLNILLVEPNRAEAERLGALLQAIPDLLAEVHPEAELSAVEGYLGSHRPHLLLLGLETAGPGSSEQVVRLRQRFPWLPVLVVASDRDAVSAASLVAQGAQDCLGQEDLLPDLLGRAIRHALARHRSEAALRANEEFFRLISENVSDLIAVIDREGRRIYNSPSYERTLGRGSDLHGTDSFAEIHPEDQERIQQVFRKTLQTGVGQRAEFRMVLPSGAVRHIESVGSVIRDDRGEPNRVVVVARDVTERREVLEGLEHALAQLRRAHRELKAAQQQLVESEKLETVSTFAGAIAHEVKNPLQTLLLGLDYFKATLPPEDTGSAAVIAEMEQATRKADAVIRGLLEFASYGRHDIGEHDLNELVGQVMRAVASEADAKRIRIDTRLTSGLPRLCLDAKKMRHVCLKLLLGAIQAAEPGGRLLVSTAIRGVGTLPMLQPSSSESSRVVLEIEDEGAGLLDSLPPPGGQREFGTAILRKAAIDFLVVRKVVELFGGHLESSPREGGGVRITIAFKT